MPNRSLNFEDNLNINDEWYEIMRTSESTGIKGTEVLFIDNDTGEVLHRDRNKTIIAGAQFTACKQFGLDKIVDLPDYNKELGIPNDSQTVPDNVPIVWGFCCGSAGCGIEASQVYPVKYNSRIKPTDLVPFRYEEIDKDLPYAQRSIYFGRKEIQEEGRVAYYYKAFDTIPQLHMKYADNTQIGSDLYNYDTDQKALTYVEARLKMTKTDFRDYFFQGEGIENARINQLSLLTGWYKTGTDGFKYYQDVLPMTQLNFTNEWLIDLTKSISIIYRLFY